jgi:hypothetical protein
MKMHIAVLDQVPDFIVPTLVAHTAIAAHMQFSTREQGGAPTYEKYDDWLQNSFKKCVVRINQKEFDKIAALSGTYLGHKNTTLDARKSCAIPVPCEDDDRPNVLKFSKLWKPIA